MLAAFYQREAFSSFFPLKTQNDAEKIFFVAAHGLGLAGQKAKDEGVGKSWCRKGVAQVPF